MYVDDSIWNAILGTFIFSALIVFVVTTAMHAYRKVRGLIRQHAKPSNVDLTLNQMYGDVNVKPDTTPYASTRNARQHWRQGG